MPKKNINPNHKKILCRPFTLNGTCPRGRAANCPNAHGVHEMQLKMTPPPVESYKTEVCEDFVTDGRFCYMGAACFKTHGATPNAERDKRICPMYRLTHRCYYPRNCPLEDHPAADKIDIPYVPRHSRHT